MENFFTAAMIAIGIPYGIMFLVLMWNVIGPATGKGRGRGVKQENPASHE